MPDHNAIVSEVRDLMAAGDKAGARRLLRRYVDGADSAIAEDLTDRARAILDAATETYAARITDSRRARAARETADRCRSFRVQRTGVTRPARSDRDAHAQKDTADYFTHRDTDTSEPDRRDPATYGSGLDYDHAAVPAMRGRGCLLCGIERSRIDHARRDGLCTDCHDDGHTRADGIAHQCDALITRTLTAHTLTGATTTPRDALAAVWRAANPTDRALIAQWAAANPHRLACTNAA